MDISKHFTQMSSNLIDHFLTGNLVSTVLEVNCYALTIEDLTEVTGNHPLIMLKVVFFFIKH